MQTFFAAVNLPMKRFVGPAIGLTVGLTGARPFGHVSRPKNRGPAGFIAALAFAVTAISVVVGPLIMRLDLRSDFEHLDLLKTWPVHFGGPDSWRDSVAGGVFRDLRLRGRASWWRRRLFSGGGDGRGKSSPFARSLGSCSRCLRAARGSRA